MSVQTFFNFPARLNGGESPRPIVQNRKGRDGLIPEIIDRRLGAIRELVRDLLFTLVLDIPCTEELGVGVVQLSEDAVDLRYRAPGGYDLPVYLGQFQAGGGMRVDTAARGIGPRLDIISLGLCLSGGKLTPPPRFSSACSRFPRCASNLSAALK